MARPKKNTSALNLRLEDELIERIDSLRRDEPGIPTRQEMIRRILEEYFEGEKG